MTVRRVVIRPVAWILMPGTMPAMRRRPSHTRWRESVPSQTSTSRAGVSSRGRSVTERTSPQTVTFVRSRASPMWTTPSRSEDSRRSCAASMSCDDRVRRSVRRRRAPGCAAVTGGPRGLSLLETVRCPGRASAHLGDLGAALEGTEAVVRRGSTRQVRVGLGRTLCVGKAQRQQLAGWHRLVAAVDDRGADDVVDGLGRGRLDGGATRHDGSQEPAGGVDADEPCRHEDGPAVRARLRHAGEQLLAELTRHHLGGATGVDDARRDLVADVDPHALGARGGEGLQLDGRLADDGGDARDLLLLLVDLQAQLHALLPAQPDGAEVEVVAVVVDLAAVERAGRAALSVGVRLVGVGLLADVDLVTLVAQVRFDRTGVRAVLRLAPAEESHVFPSFESCCPAGVVPVRGGGPSRADPAPGEPYPMITPLRATPPVSARPQSG